MRIAISGAALSAVVFASAVAAQDMDQTQQDSYMMGLDVGESIKATGMEPDLDAVMRGLRDALEGNDYAVTQEQRQAFGARIQQMQRDAAQKAREEIAMTNATAAQEFLAENAQRDTVLTTDSGLQYEVMAEGEGEHPSATDTVTVHYAGTLLDGTEFDSSYKRGQPISFALNRVIPGWTEGVQLMKPGAKYKLFIPPELGYGERGAPGVIPPNSALIFEVELISIGAAE